MCDIHPSAHVTRFPKARLPHACESCGHAIMPGETYRYDSGIWDGSASNFRRHLLCATLEALLVDDEGCWEIGNLNEAHDYPASESPVFQRAWEVCMRRRWIDDDSEVSPWLETPCTP